MQDKKKIVIGALCALIMIMAVGYALLSQQLSINGSASITSNWQVEITNITEKEKSTGATTNSTNYTATTASFNTSLTSPGDYATYEVTVTNKGTLDAVLAANPTVTTGNNEAITYELEGIKKGDKILKNNQTDTFTIKIQYNPSTTTQPSTLTSDIEVTLNYEQDLGQVVVYDTYSIGDVISFNNANWRVIKASTEDEDYVTLIKEQVLTAKEIGNDYSLKKPTDGTARSNAAYYWSDTCHFSQKYGTDNYYSTDTSGCSGHNDYAGSKIRGALEGYMANYLDASDLKEVDEYKIRLITIDELINNLGCTMESSPAYNCESSSYSSWIYGSSIGDYWTMTPYTENLLRIFTVNLAGGFGNEQFCYHNARVRPVINLLKSAIE